MPNDKRPKRIKLPPSFREQIDAHYGTWVNMPYLCKLIDSAEFWQKRYHDPAGHVFEDWQLDVHLLKNSKSTGRPKEDHADRDRKWSEQMVEYVANGLSQRKASEIIAEGPEARRDNVTAKTVRNAVNKLRKSSPTSARRADAETPAQR
jgi:hypothetical protein